MTRLLVAEDSETILLLLKTRLEMAGYEVVTAANGQEAIDRSRETEPDLLLLDVMMPVKSGLDALVEIRAAGDRTPVILCTAHRDQSGMQRGLEAGADAYVPKPIDFDDLLKKIEELVPDP